MASLQIEGDTGKVTERQIQFIRDVLERRGFTNNKVVFEAVGKAGDNYVADVKRISVIADGEEDFKMIAKFAPENIVLRKMMNTNILFNNEILMYEEILPKLVSLQRDADVPENEWFRFAECYGTLAEEPHEVVLLEDLNVSNFTMLDRFSSLDNDAVRLVLKNFAILHSLSYALKKLEPETYEKFTSKLMDMWEFTKDTQEFFGFMKKLEEEAIDIVDDNYKSALVDKVSQFPAIYGKITKADKHSKHLVIQQGDSWTNNILFMLKENKPVECIMIDYQLSYEKNPVCDLLYFLFSSTDAKTKSKYYNDWIDYYHLQLDKSLSNFGMSATSTYSRDHLDVDLKRYSKLFFGNSIMLSSILCRKPDEALAIKEAMNDEDMDKREDLGLDSVSNDTVQLYKSRVEGLIDNYREFGYMKE